MTDGLGKRVPARFMNVGGERTEASAMMTEILLSPIFRASDFTVNVKDSFPRFNLHQRFLYREEAPLILFSEADCSEFISQEDR